MPSILRTPKDEFSRIKVVVIGDSNVGKSTLVSNLIKNLPTNPDETNASGIYSLPSSSYYCKFNVWDTLGQERYTSMPKLFYNNAKIGLIVYDSTNLQSFENCTRWLNELLSISSKCRCILVASKTDLASRIVSREEGRELANKLDIRYLEASTKYDASIQAIRQEIENLAEESVLQRQAEKSRFLKHAC